ncbi:MAG: flagellar biosynthesis anti-sigma factor FlgM [Erythrobacter sp.]|nr:flagellar biosynthesis anti-sigma factor FlgM [Erythrobacter sp.]
MPSVELNKLVGITPARALSESDRPQVDTRAPAVAARPAAAAGISVEVSAPAADTAPPVDAERVQQIRSALQNGTYPLVPAKIADAIIAAQVSLSLPQQG